MPTKKTKVDLHKQSSTRSGDDLNMLYFKYFKPSDDAAHIRSHVNFEIYSPFDYSIPQIFTNKTDS